MPFWKCTNKIFNKTCGNIVESAFKPIIICQSCKKPTAWIMESTPKLKRQKGLILNEEQTRKYNVPRIISGLRLYSLETYFAGEIVRFVKEVGSDPNRGWIGMTQDLDRVKSRLHFVWQFYNNADYLTKELSPESSWELVQDLDIALQRLWNVAGGLLGGTQDYKNWASNPSQLKIYGQKVIKETEKIWRALVSDEDKEKFITHVFEHDKGYNRIIGFIETWGLGVRPEKQEPKELIHGEGVGKLSRDGGTIAFGPLSIMFNLPQTEIRSGMNGGWKDRVFHQEGDGNFKMTGWNQLQRLYSYEFLDSVIKK